MISRSTTLFLALLFALSLAFADSVALVHAGSHNRGSAAGELPATPLRGDLISVADGDSFVLRAADGRVWQVRIAAIDAPERAQPWSDVARRQLLGRLQGREILVEAMKFDMFGRVVGNVYVLDQDIGLAQIQDGFAWHFRRYAREQPPEQRARYASTEAAARTARRGLWREPAPVAPWIYRKEQRGTTRAGKMRQEATAPHEAAGPRQSPLSGR